MLVYELLPQEPGQHVVRTPSLTWTDMPGVRQGASWVPVEVELVDQGGRRTYQQVDGPYLDGSSLVIAVLPRVHTELAPAAEFLPLACRREPLTLVNVLTIGGCGGRRRVRGRALFCTEPTALLLRERLTGVNVQPVWEA